MFRRGDSLPGLYRRPPIIRNAQERRQLAAIKAWLEARHYRQIDAGNGTKFNVMPPGTYSFSK